MATKSRRETTKTAGAVNDGTVRATSGDEAGDAGSSPAGNSNTKDSTDRTDNVIGQNVLGDFRPADLLDIADLLAQQAIKQPLALGTAVLGFWGELAKILAGESTLAPERSDRRFADQAWRDNRIYSSLLQSYLALVQSAMRYAKNSGLDDRQAERAQFSAQVAMLWRSAYKIH
jgi:polyhydroxyalkanoate synthase